MHMFDIGNFHSFNKPKFYIQFVKVNKTLVTSEILETKNELSFRTNCLSEIVGSVLSLLIKDIMMAFSVTNEVQNEMVPCQSN